MRTKGLGDIMRTRSSRGLHNLKTRPASTPENEKHPKLYRLDIEKDCLSKKLEQFERQKAQIEKRLEEINLTMQNEISRLGEQESKGEEKESTMPEKEEEPKKKIELDFGIGKLSFGDIFQGIGNFIDLVSRMEEEGEGEEKREGEFTSPSGRVKAVYGLSVKKGVGGKPVIEPFGNVKRTTQGAVVEDEIQPLADVFDEEDHVLIIVELPGVDAKHIHTEMKGDILTLAAASGGRKYAREVVLPKGVDASTMTSKYRNGVLEIKMNKQ